MRGNRLRSSSRGRSKTLQAAGLRKVVVEDCVVSLPRTRFSGTLDELREAVALYEGGIDYLDGLGLIDLARVGIVGFSRSGLFVQYALTHSRYHFGAATQADISDAGYFLYLALFNSFPVSLSGPEGINGGAPFGDGLASWIRNSPGFNLDKVTAPIRLEADSPTSLFAEWEWFAGLSRLNKPVELIYIRDGDHPWLSQMPLIHRNDMIQQVSSATFDPTLRHAVLPGTLEGGPHRAHLQGSNGHGYFRSVFRIPVEDQNPGSRPKWKASRNCWTTHGLVGCWVTLKCRMRRRSWLMMKKQ